MLDRVVDVDGSFFVEIIIVAKTGYDFWCPVFAGSLVVGKWFLNE